MLSLFVGSLLLVLWTYAGYPLWVALRARGAVPPTPIPDGDQEVSVVIAARNEAAALPAKLRSLLQSDAAGRIREIWIGADACSDGTAEACLAVDDPRIRVERFEPACGKPSVLNTLVPRCEAPLLLLTDARQSFAPDALGRLLARIREPGVGVVSGELAFRDADGKDCGMGAYWRYETWIRRNESKGRGVPGSTGAITLLRREAFAPMPADTLLDDVFLPMHAMEQGWRCVFEPGAIAWDLPSASASRERVRKRRTLAGNLQLLFRTPRWILPGGHPLAFAFLHHKIMRLLVPFALIALFASNLALAGHPFFQVLLAGQVGFYGLALAGRIGAGGVPGRLAYLFWELNAAALLAWADALRGNYRVVWDRSDKTPSR